MSHSTGQYMSLREETQLEGRAHAFLWAQGLTLGLADGIILAANPMTHECRKSKGRDVGVAHGYEFPNDGALASSEFNGGEATVKRKLEELGFTVCVLPK